MTMTGYPGDQGDGFPSALVEIQKVDRINEKGK